MTDTDKRIKFVNKFNPGWVSSPNCNVLQWAGCNCREVLEKCPPQERDNIIATWGELTVS